MFNALFVPIMVIMAILNFALQLVLSFRNVSLAVKFIPVYPCVIGMIVSTVVFYQNPSGNEVGYDPAAFVIFMALLCVLVVTELAWLVHWIIEKIDEKKFMEQNKENL